MNICLHVYTDADTNQVRIWNVVTHTPGAPSRPLPVGSLQRRAMLLTPIAFGIRLVLRASELDMRGSTEYDQTLCFCLLFVST